MGFDCNLVVGTYNPNTICRICLDVIEDPSECKPCCHTFCATCINAWLSKHKFCPIDRLPVITRKSSTGIVYKLLLRTRIKCKFRKYGCTDELYLIEFRDHLKQCLFHPEKEYICSKGCGCEVKRKHERRHNCIQHLAGLIAKYQPRICGQSLCLPDSQQSLDSLKSEWSDMCKFIYMKYGIDLRPKDTSITYPHIVRKNLFDWGASLPLATVERWQNIYASPTRIMLEELKNALVACKCPAGFLKSFLQNCNERYWPPGIGDLCIRRLNCDKLKNYVLRKIPNMQAVVMIFYQNKHIDPHFKLYPGLTFIFESGVHELI
ncbi:E3 ubiquitin-protein ligase NRDP1-like [Teleopsis dalmanni]|uniref:E3 ubiquitin-protein ligase NRDP1-like n=1 Tax=Teleopsis dalmanni TaxID=139649 RepID=UPI0018CF3878|nr:E3 ubiquitin-protein ligase NRDP1-like [Teleopsis dalmanni]